MSVKNSVKPENSHVSRMVTVFLRDGNVTEKKIALMDPMKKTAHSLMYSVMTENSNAKQESLGN